VFFFRFFGRAVGKNKNTSEKVKNIGKPKSVRREGANEKKCKKADLIKCKRKRGRMRERCANVAKFLRFLVCFEETKITWDQNPCSHAPHKNVTPFSLTGDIP